jgi:hypothetical protein
MPGEWVVDLCAAYAFHMERSRWALDAQCATMIGCTQSIGLRPSQFSVMISGCAA